VRENYQEAPMALSQDEKNTLGGSISEQGLEAAEKLIQAAHEGGRGAP
jgi:hypothetical protein